MAQYHEDESFEIDDESYKIFIDLYRSICKTLEKQGYDIIEYQCSEENFRYHCEVNEILFLQSGVKFSLLDGVIVNE